jgi:hypothetical protein
MQGALRSLEIGLNSMQRLGVHYLGSRDPARTRAGSLLRTYGAVYCVSHRRTQNLDASSKPGVFRATTSTAGLTPAQLVAEGRRAAFDICPYLLRVLG